MTQEELNEILEQHQLWLDTKGEEGKRADLRGADLTGVDLTGVDLTGVDLRYAYLKGVDLRDANLTCANLEGVYLIGANLEGADLEGVNLKNAYLRGANLEDTGVYFFKGTNHDAIYNSKDDNLFIGCQVQTLEHWLQNYIDIGKKYKYSDEEIEKYGNWIKPLKELK